MSKHIVVDARIRRTSTGRYTHNLVEHLQNIDKTNRYTILVEPDDPWEMTNKKFTTVSAPYAQFSFSLREQINFTRQLKALKADVIHFTMTQFPVFFNHDHIVVTTHDLGMLKTHRPKKTNPLVFTLKKMGYKLLLWQSHKKARRIIVPSNYVKKDVQNYHPFTKRKITRTYESGASQKHIEAKRPAGIHKHFLLYQGTPFPHKNVRALVDAFSLLCKDNPDLHLHMNGKREYYYEQLEKYVATLDCKDNIHINGYVSDANSKWMFENCLAYVLPTTDEGFGLTGLEAMEQGAPVVCSDIPVLREVYGDAPEFFDPHDINDIVLKIMKVISDESLRKTMRKKGYQQIKKYSWTTMAKETLAIYEKI